ncbi:hypothetical protein CLAVI_000316 [Candidatus Clavichlamydia salmonicola]|uniref:hypothetical protein n=1 Tax=Candidatus Clavichlamydia salmonicola TaxID=469812 RepID=UPI001891A3B8|nr:hypothetical protein [Candidatus Clavichlamydia salmonicola]MBF5050701.1 hypothetical protein [Candidatus Clavichlamydia salmonicola]
MVILPFRDIFPVVDDGNQMESLSPSVPFIQSWCNGLYEFFFGNQGMLVNSRVNASQDRCYLNLNCSYISARDSLLEQAEIHITIAPVRLFPKGDLYEYLEEEICAIGELIQRVKGHDEEKIHIFFLTIDQLCFEGEYVNLPACKQLIASFLRLYKDVLVFRLSVLEGSCSNMLKEALSKLPERPSEAVSCNALREMILQAKIWSNTFLRRQDEETVLSDKIDTCLIDAMEGALGISFEVNRRYKHLSEDELVHWLEFLSEGDFVQLLIIGQHLFPIKILQKILKNKPKSTWEIILNRLSIELLRIVPLELLQEILMDVSHSNLITCVSNMPIIMLINILQEIPKNLLNQVLLELPFGVICDLKQRMGDMPLWKHVLQRIDEYLSGLQMNKNNEESFLKAKERPVPSLLLLSSSAICKYPIKSVIEGQEQVLAPWGAQYIDQLLLANPEIKEYVKIFAKINDLSSEVFPRVVFDRSRDPLYSKECDLFQLASLLPGCDDFIKKALVARCV